MKPGNRGLTPISSAYTMLLYGMAWGAGLLIATMMVVITLDVVVRNLGFQSSGHFFTFTEYALLLVPCLGAPWLVRERGHVYVEILLMVLQPRHRAALRVGIAIVCIVVCAILAWYGFDLTIRDYLGNEKDVRSLDMPRWMLVAFVPLSFTMMAIEFLRFLLRGEDFLGSLTMQKE